METDHRCQCKDCLEHPYSAMAKDHRVLNRCLRDLDERCRRLFVGYLAQQRGYGGISLISKITGCSRNTILRGLQEIHSNHKIKATQVRRSGGGRKRIEKKDQRSFLS